MVQLLGKIPTGVWNFFGKIFNLIFAPLAVVLGIKFIEGMENKDVFDREDTVGKASIVAGTFLGFFVAYRLVTGGRRRRRW